MGPEINIYNRNMGLFLDQHIKFGSFFQKPEKANFCAIISESCMFRTDAIAILDGGVIYVIYPRDTDRISLRFGTRVIWSD